MIWYMLDEESTPLVFTRGQFTYPVLDVINTTHNTTEYTETHENEEKSEEEKSDD